MVSGILRSGITYIDLTFGGGLYPRKVVEVFGSESSGKSAIFQSLMIRYSDQVDEIHYFDIEEAFDPIKYKLMGGDPDKISVYGSMTLDDFTSEFKKIISKKDEKKRLIVWDTLGATLPKDDKGIQRRPQMIREFLASIRSVKSSYYFVILNQAYEKIGSMVGGITSPGGRGLRHFTDLRVKLARTSTVKSPDKKPIGIEGNITVVKSRISYEGLSVPYYLDIVNGIDPIRSILIFLKFIGAFQMKAGSVKVINFGDDEYKWQTVEQFSSMFENDERFRKVIDFLTYNYFVNFSSILRVKYASEYNELAKYFELPELELTEEELEAYNLFVSGRQDDQDKRD